MTHSHAIDRACEEHVEPEVRKLMLFTTKTCPNCKMAKMMLDKAGIEYTAIDAEDNADLTVSMGVKKAPTLLVPSEEGYEVYSNASEIKGWIENRK